MKSLKKSITAFLSLFLLTAFVFAGNKDNKKQRIVSLGPSATEIIFAIGAQDQLVARTDLCDFPPQAKNVPSVGGFAANTISLESIISFEPTLVYLFAGMHDNFVQPLKDLGISVYVSNATCINDVKNEILEIGKLTGHEKQAAKVVKEMNEKLALAKSFYQKKDLERPTVYWEVWNSPMMSIGKNSFMNDIINYAGGKNIFEEQENAYPMVSEEAVLYAAPDFIFYSGDGMGGRKPTLKYAAPKGMYFMGDDDSFVRSSPRCADAVLKLAKLFWKGSAN